MDRLVEKYAAKLRESGLVASDGFVLGGLDEQWVWNRDDSRAETIVEAMGTLGMGVGLVGTPVEPYASIVRYLSRAGTTVFPRDSETRTFLHDVPVLARFDAASVTDALSRRKVGLLPDGSVVAGGGVSPLEPVVNFSSACFAVFVKFMVDCLEGARQGTLDDEARAIAEQVLQTQPQPAPPPLRHKGPFYGEEDVVQAMVEAGRVTVDHRLVDSHFGNISCLHDDTLYISQTGALLDELEDCIDPCRMEDGASITASSEYMAHRLVYDRTGCDVILHGHPRFTVVMSLYCVEACDHRDRCYTGCTASRFVDGVPIVGGEVGAGPNGLFQTVPHALVSNDAAIVLGHGLFVRAQTDFTDAIERMFSLEAFSMTAFSDALSGKGRTD